MPRDWMSINTGPPDVDGMSITDVDQNKADVDEPQRDGGMSISIADVDAQIAPGGWFKDPREEKEPWRARHTAQRCEGLEPDGTTCGALTRGSTRCVDHVRSCWATNRKGEPCQNSAILPGLFEDPETGETREVDWCAAHPRAGVNRKLPGVAGPEALTAPDQAWGSPEQAAEAGRLGGLARRYPRLNEEITRQIEERAAQVVGAGIEALDATKPVVVEESGTDENGRRFTRQEVVEYPDHLVRLKAHEALTSRAFGRPHQAMDINQETRQLTLALDATDPVVREGLHSFLRQRPGVAA